jgi:hypothetical protein
MEVLIDGKRMEAEPEGDNLQQMMQFIMTNWVAPDRALRELKVNGDFYKEAEMGPVETIARQRVNHLEVETSAGQDLARDFLSAAEDYPPAIAQAVSEVAELFRVSDEREASERYINVLETLQLFLTMLEESRRMLDLDLAAIMYEGRTVADALTRLSELIKELLSAQESEDWVLLADLLEYDLKPELIQWRDIARLLGEKARA